MDKQEELRIINGLGFQKRLELMVDHGFASEASDLLRCLASTNTCMCCVSRDGELSDLCLKKDRSGVWVIITSSNRLEYTPASGGPREGGDWYVVFELGWERMALGWTEKDSQELVRTVLAHALAHPLNQWSFPQAEGTMRACRTLPKEDGLAREISALYMVYHLRQADFGRIFSHLAGFDGFDLTGRGKDDVDAMIGWMIDRLSGYGWTTDRIHKEFSEWLWLKTGTWPEWCLAIARSKAFTSDDQVRQVAVRHWIHGHEDWSLDGMSEKPESAAALVELFRLIQPGVGDRAWFEDKLVKRLASGEFKGPERLHKQYRDVLGINPFCKLLVRAMHVAAESGRYGIAIALAKRCRQDPDPSWVEIAKIRKLPSKLE